MATWNTAANTIFLRAVELNAPDERAAYLAEACGADADLRGQVEALLQADAAASGFLQQPVVPPDVTGNFETAEADQTQRAKGEQPGTCIGPYKLLQKIGEGGMGTVWLAEQQQPVRRQVALKVIKAGMDSAQVLARFEAERQALALMDHPHIARVFDGGTTDTGQPYFVMELVKGVPITRYCDEHCLSPRQRLELFMPVCQAIQHAHQKGIIHRDVKPSNVLVAPYDGKPVVKVIDFGVAKATGQRLTERTLFTEFGAVVGTLEYMSPEQAELNNHDIDTRSDIYSLGVLLYELLTGTTPLDRTRLKQAAFMEMLRIIREEEPPKPSTRLSESPDSLPSISAQRQTEPAKLRKLVRGELDWIVMKALEKDRNRRYETANGLAMDVQRYLCDEPVVAGPPSVRYRLRKFVRRNKGPVIALAAIFLLLIAGITGTTWGLVREAERAEGERLAKLDAQDAQRKEAERAEAEKEARKAEAAQRKQSEAVADLLVSAFQGLNPRREQQGEPDLKEQLLAHLDEATERLNEKYSGEPLVRARLRVVLGNTYLGLGDPYEAVSLLEAARDERARLLGADHLETLACLNELGLAYVETGQFDRAIEIHDHVGRAYESNLGTQHLDTLGSKHNLAAAYRSASRPDKAIPLFEEILPLLKSQFGSAHPHTMQSMNSLAVAYRAAGKPGLALPLFEQVLAERRKKLADTHPDILWSTNNLAVVYQDMGKVDQALTMLKEATENAKAKLGVGHPQTLTTMNNLALAIRQAGRMDQALQLHEETAKLSKAKLGPDHPLTLLALGNWADTCHAAGLLEQCVTLREQSLQLRTSRLGEEHPDTLLAAIKLAQALRDADRLSQALPVMERRAVRLCRTELGENHTHTVHGMANLASAYWAAGKLDKSVPLFEETLKKLKAKSGPDHPDTLQVMTSLGVNYRDARRQEEAERVGEQALERCRAILGPSHPTTRYSLSSLIATYEKAYAHTKVEPLFWAQLANEQAQHGTDHPDTIDTRVRLGLCLLGQRKYAEAEAPLRTCLTLQEKHHPDSWITFNIRTMVGVSVLRQRRYAEAEPLLLQGYEGMKQRSSKIPTEGLARLTEALELLVKLYDAWGKPDEAAKWRKELESKKQ